jgi:hypothetical protein
MTIGTPPHRRIGQPVIGVVVVVRGAGRGRP